MVFFYRSLPEKGIDASCVTAITLINPWLRAIMPGWDRSGNVATGHLPGSASEIVNVRQLVFIRRSRTPIAGGLSRRSWSVAKRSVSKVRNVGLLLPTTETPNHLLD